MKASHVVHGRVLAYKAQGPVFKPQRGKNIMKELVTKKYLQNKILEQAQLTHSNSKQVIDCRHGGRGLGD